MQCGYVTNNRLVAVVHAGGANKAVYDWNLTYTAGVPTHIRFVYDSTASGSNKIKFYQDHVDKGTPIGTGPNLTWSITDPLTFDIGRISWNRGGNGSGGSVDNFEIYSYQNTADLSTEYSQTVSIYENTIYRDPGKQLHLWNKLGAKEEVENSVIGPSFAENGTFSYVAGKFGDAYEGASNAYLELNGDHTTFVDMSQGCFEMWYYPTTGFNNSLGNLFSFFSGADPFSYVQALTHSNGQFHYYIRNPSFASVIIPDTDTIFTINTWHHVAFVYQQSGIDGTSDTMRMYVDGVDVGSATTDFGTTEYLTSPEARIGNDWSGGNNWYVRGRIDNFKYYNYAKTDFSDRESEVSLNIADLPKEI
jgi:hypothetical protein